MGAEIRIESNQPPPGGATKVKIMTRQEILADLKNKKELRLVHFKALGLSFEQFLRYAQFSPARSEKVVNGFISLLEKQVAEGK